MCAIYRYQFYLNKSGKIINWLYLSIYFICQCPAIYANGQRSNSVGSARKMIFHCIAIENSMSSLFVKLRIFKQTLFPRLLYSKPLSWWRWLHFSHSWVTELINFDFQYCFCMCGLGQGCHGHFCMCGLGQGCHSHEVHLQGGVQKDQMHWSIL